MLVESLIEHPECVCEVADQFGFRIVVLVDLRRQEIGMQDTVVLVRVPKLRVVLDHVEAECNHKVSVIDRSVDPILSTQTHGIEAVVSVHIHTALGHEGADHTDAGFFAQ